MIKGNHKYLEEIARTHVCAEHPDLALAVAHHREEGWVIRCGGGHYPDALQSLSSWTELWRRGEHIPPEIKENIERRERMRQERKAPPSEGGEQRLPAIYDASKGELAPRELALEAITFAKRTGLRPELGHICLYFGRPWVTIDGWYYRFRSKYPRGKVVTSPLLGNDRIALGVDEGTHAWKAEVYEEDGGKLLSVGYGYAREGEEPLARASAVEPRWPWRMAEKRAEEDALRKVVPLEIEGE